MPSPQPKAPYTTPDYLPHQTGDATYEVSKIYSVGGAASTAEQTGVGLYLIKSTWGPCQMALQYATFTVGGKAGLSYNSNENATANFVAALQFGNDMVEGVLFAGANNSMIPLNAESWFNYESPMTFIVGSGTTAFLAFQFRRPRQIRRGLPPTLYDPSENDSRPNDEQAGFEQGLIKEHFFSRR